MPIRNTFSQRDSLTKCTTYSNPFDIKTYPTRVVPLPHSKDTLESSREALEKDALQHLESATGKIPLILYVAICRVGKYAFLAVAFPPYMVLFLLPKWMIRKAFPKMMRKVRLAFVKIANVKNQAVNGLKGMLQSAIQKALRPPLQLLQQAILATSSFISRSVKKGKDKIQSAANHTLNALLSPFQHLYRKMVSPLKKLNDIVSKARTRTKSLKQATQHFPMRLGETFSRIYHRSKLLIERGRQKIVSKAVTLGKGVKQLFQTASQKAQRIMTQMEEWATIPLQSINKRIKEIRNRVKEGSKVVQQVVITPIERVVSLGWVWFKMANERVSRLLTPINKARATSLRRAGQWLQQKKSGVKSLLQKIGAFLPQKVRKAVFDNPATTLLRDIIKALIRGLSLFICGVGSAIRWGIKTLGASLKKGLSWTWLGLQWIERQLIQILEKLTSCFVFLCKKGIYWFLIIAILFVYLVFTALRLLNDTAGYAKVK